ncbi:bifunctional tetrahydrofolate synthase/dihydrofolate synthase [Thiocapsa roseopersicina]|uniref:Dihydrofolate synthase/folylpolyglutamate synthase n=1 Tax=Thiocapsa roseopersicina TaxID=1058 RepID=A0A1H2TUH9_THIRO|nr:bifunctional tetrahydrofolate synthase/dihydrofolate synthase [Thiocapsa roseopersicina]SDW47388.1 dihydrofolate synthase / folylpolyglutamate synthase [Thiocapsa roseopersicina]
MADMNRLDNLDAWLSWQMQLHPKAIALGLERVAAVWARLGPASLPFPLVTVGGTNGKGSCVAMAEAICRAAGYRTGVYSSPHLLRYNERVRIDGEDVSDALLCEAFERIDRARGEMALTYFEFGTLAALDIFVRSAPDIVILEVGLGGRLDAVNLWDADVSVVTSIGLDHMAWLGDSLDEIAYEKAGIFRPGRPAVIGQRDAPARLRAEAQLRGSLPMQLGREIDWSLGDGGGWIWSAPSGERLALPEPAMRGPFQYDNASAAIAALRALQECLPISVNAIRAGLQRARLPGRFQVFPGSLTWILDVAHNGEAAQALAANLRAFACRGRLRAVLAVLEDKSPESIVGPLLPFVGDWYLAQSRDPRAMPVEVLSKRLEGALPAPAAVLLSDLDAALDAAEAASEPGDALLVVGSFTTVGAALRRLDPGRGDRG